jgi:predicted metal-dependent peptidase
MTVDKLAVARYIAIRKAPYFAHALFRTPVITTTAVPTAAMDMHGRMYINPHIIDSWTPEHLATMLVHEMFHFLNEHFARKGARKQKRWNIATDMEIANILRTMDFRLDTPIPHITPEQYNLPENLLAEEYYDRLKSNADGNGNDESNSEGPSRGDLKSGTDDGSGNESTDGYPSGSASDGIERPWELPAEDAEYPALSETEQEILRREVARAVEEHYKNKGDIPAGLERLCNRVRQKKEIDWRVLLRRTVKDIIYTGGSGDQFTYRRPNRRKQNSTFIFPSMVRIRPKVAVVIDTSGSMNDAELQKAQQEVASLLQEIRSEITVLSVDAEVHTIQRIRNANRIQLKGGGGTDMMVGIRTAAALRQRPNLIIVITDGYTDWDTRPPRNTPPVIAVLTDKKSATPPSWIRSIRVNIS